MHTCQNNFNPLDESGQRKQTRITKAANSDRSSNMIIPLHSTFHDSYTVLNSKGTFVDNVICYQKCLKLSHFYQPISFFYILTETSPEYFILKSQHKVNDLTSPQT